MKTSFHKGPGLFSGPILLPEACNMWAAYTLWHVKRLLL